MKRYEIYTKEKGLIKVDVVTAEMMDLTWHRENGPAFTKYDKDYNILLKSYWYDGRRHNKLGSAYVEYSNNQIFVESYYLYGMEYSYDNWLIQPEVKKCMRKEKLKLI